jgi:hypothetical protein
MEEKTSEFGWSFLCGKTAVSNVIDDFKNG